MPAGSIVTLQNVGKVFANGARALDGLSLNVRAGEFLTLLGPSGCGKSTALRLIAALNEPTEGSIDWADHARRAPGEIGFVFQEPTLMPWTTVENNVALPLRLKRADSAETASRVSKALESVGLSRFARAYPRELSGGMKMRASIARALVTRPRLLLMDEPFAALDEITRSRLNNDLMALTEALEMTVVFVTHSVFESVFLSKRIIVMTPHPGRVFQELEIAAPYPRAESFRTSPEYAEYCRRASALLSAAMEPLEPAT
jgi:NitT/TauT family transport system ATP-binding protein